MFYRRYYSGTIASATATDSVSISEINMSSFTRYTNQSKVYCEALIDFLHHVGFPNAAYVHSEATIYFDRVKFPNNRVIVYYSNQMVLTYRLSYKYKNGDNWTWSYSTFSSSSGAAYQPFSGTSYKFYITAKGDPTSCIRINTGFYNSTAAVTAGFILVNAIDKRDDSDLFVINLSPSSGIAYSTSTFYAIKKDCSSINESGLSSSSVITANLSTINGIIPLINLILRDGIVELKNCYFYPFSTSGENYFLTIEGVEYYGPNSYMLIKCPTQPT